MTINFKYEHILRDLYESSQGFYVYTIFPRYDVDTADAIRFVEIFSDKEKEVVEFDEDNIRVRLTKFGRDHFSEVLEQLRKMKLETSQSYLETIRCPQKPLYEPYVPKLNNKAL